MKLLFCVSMIFLLSWLVEGGSVKLFSELTLSIVRAHSTRTKTSTGQRQQQQAPDLYVYITAVAPSGNGSKAADPGIEFFFAKTRVVKGNYKPVFNESFFYARDPLVPYTLGTDNLLRVYLYDQATGWGSDESLGFFEMDLNQEATDRLEGRALGSAPPERAGFIDYHGYRSTVTYKIDLMIDAHGSRTPGAMKDDDHAPQ